MTADIYALPPEVVSGSAESAGLSGLDDTPLEELAEHFQRYIKFASDLDAYLLVLWAAHTHATDETYTTPRLQVDAATHGSGKTTVLDHLRRVCLNPVQAASLSSTALLVRLLEKGTRTIMIDEADRSLNPNKPGIEDLIAVINSGYKQGSTRPVLVSGKNGEWDAKEMPTYAPVALAGNNPHLPDDTKSRIIRVLLLPDVHGEVEDSDWELIEQDLINLGARVAEWVDRHRDVIRQRPELPPEIKGRARERWAPLKRIAVAAGGHWPGVVDNLAVQDHERVMADREDGLAAEKPHVVLLRNLHEIWADSQSPFIPTEALLAQLTQRWPEMWGSGNFLGKPLTATRMGRMLTQSFEVRSCRPDTQGPRGYTRASLAKAFRAFALDPL